MALKIIAQLCNDELIKIRVELPNTIIKAAPTAPPEVTPIKLGSARGLRNKPCSTVPLTARLMPTIIASMVRGMRSASMTCLISGDISGNPICVPKPPKHEFITSAGLIFIDPTLRAINPQNDIISNNSTIR